MESPPSNEQTLPPGSAPATRWPRLRLAARSLLSLLVGAASILCAVLLVRNGLVPLVDTLFHPDPAALSLVRRIGIFFGALAGYAAYVHWVERRSADELRLQPRRLLMAAGGGALMAGLPITVLFAIGAYQLVELRMASSALWSVAALILIAAMLEELLHRALLFRLLERTLGTGIALVLQALVFAAPHLENLERGSAYDVIALVVSVTMLGLLWAALFVLTRNLWTCVVHHAAWNFTILLSGVPLSGIDDWRALTPLHSRLAGPDWLTGGQFGPESSLLLILVATIATAAFLRAAKRRGCLRSGLGAARSS